MERTRGSRRIRCLVLAVLALLVVGAAPAAARPIPPHPTVELGSVAGLAPDSRSVDVHVVASCPDRWSVRDARVSVSQPQASGTALFPLSCTGAPQLLTVAVRSATGAFQLGEAQADALVQIERGRVLTAQDSAVVRVVPNAFVDLADTGRLDGGGTAVLIDVTVACPVGSDSAQVGVSIYQGGASGSAGQAVTCDGQRHTVTLRVAASRGLFTPGSAQGSAVVTIEEGGDIFFAAEDTQQIQIIAP